MHLLTIDAESFWSTEHSLSRMSPIAYVMHPETEIISMSAKVDDGKTVCVFGEEEARRLLVDCGIEESLCIGHNMSMFDALVVAWRLKLKPRMWGCTLSMARPVHGRILHSLSLATLVRFHGIGVKNEAVLVQTKGKHLADFTPDEVERMRIYNVEDTEQCHGLFKIYKPHTSGREMWAIDSNIRMMVEDAFVLDQPLLRAALAREKKRKHKTLVQLGEQLGIAENNDTFLAMAVKSELMSALKFKRLLENLGVEVPMKPSPKHPDDPSMWIPALAKTDPEFKHLLEHDNEIVQAAARARLDLKSTLLETRIEAFLDAANWRTGRLPIPAKYAGAHTYRDSGDLYNALNMPRIDRDKNDIIVPKNSNALRLSVRAPEGKVNIVADLSGIEMRINHHLWKVKYSTELWKKDATADIYKPTAATYYGIDEADVAKPERQFGKVLQLACGFQCGPTKFKAFAWGKFGLPLTEAEATNGVYGWRNMTPEIADRDHGGWARCQRAMDFMMAGQERDIDPWGLTHTTREAIVLPDGNLLRYHDLRRVVQEKDGQLAYVYGHGRHTRYLYGGKADENIVQALGRIILMDNVMEFWRRTGLRPTLRVYDEAVYVVEERHAEALLAELLAIMRTPPKWWPQLVVWSEGDMHVSYGMAK